MILRQKYLNVPRLVFGCYLESTAASLPGPLEALGKESEKGKIKTFCRQLNPCRGPKHQRPHLDTSQFVLNISRPQTSLHEYLKSHVFDVLLSSRPPVVPGAENTFGAPAAPRPAALSENVRMVFETRPNVCHTNGERTAHYISSSYHLCASSFGDMSETREKSCVFRRVLGRFSVCVCVIQKSWQAC